MKSANFIDYVKIFCRSGNGGKGSTHLRRDKITTKGGPDGGDGGNGGDIIMRGNENLWTLLHLKYKRHIFAEHGADGSSNRKSGKTGNEKIVEVPIGSIAKNAETNETIGEITADKQEIILLKGGRGGRGNWHFKTATRQTPRFSQAGETGVEKSIIIELKVLADVGLVGLPNAGKSTLLSVVSAAKPKIADYPFTTLTPNLGIVSYKNEQSFVMADIPGIIEGAHKGKGLGIRFLRHIERNAILLFMVPCDSDDIKKEYDILLNELQKFNPELMDKTRILAITKCDLIPYDELKKLNPNVEIPTIFISAITNKGLAVLKDEIWKNLIPL